MFSKPSLTGHDERAGVQFGAALHATEMGANAGRHSLAAILSRGEDFTS